MTWRRIALLLHQAAVDQAAEVRDLRRTLRLREALCRAQQSELRDAHARIRLLEEQHATDVVFLAMVGRRWEHPSGREDG